MDLFSVARAPLGATSAGAPVEGLELRHAGCSVSLCTLGAALTSVRLAGGVEVTASYRGPGSVAALESRALNPYLGASIGRVANRTAGARVVGLSAGDADIAPALSVNDGPNWLHGGSSGFDSRVWSVDYAESSISHCAVSLSLHSPDGDQGFPGALEAHVVYSLSASTLKGARRSSACLGIEYRSRLEKGQATNVVTPVAMTNHAYFALQGAPSDPAALKAGSAMPLELTLHATRLIPLRECDWLPSAVSSVPVELATGGGGAGERGAVGALDFRVPARLGDKLALLIRGGEIDLRQGINAFFLTDGWACCMTAAAVLSA